MWGLVGVFVTPPGVSVSPQNKGGLPEQERSTGNSVLQVEVPLTYADLGLDRSCGFFVILVYNAISVVCPSL